MLVSIWRFQLAEKSISVSIRNGCSNVLARITGRVAVLTSSAADWMDSGECCLPDTSAALATDHVTPPHSTLDVLSTYPAGISLVAAGAPSTEDDGVNFGGKSFADSVQAYNCDPARTSLRSASSSDYTVPRTRTKFSDRAFSVAGPVVWNSLPAAVREADSLHSFRRKLNFSKHICLLTMTD